MLYKLANFKKSGQLVEAFNTGGSKEVTGILDIQTRHRYNTRGYKEVTGILYTETRHRYDTTFWPLKSFLTTTLKSSRFNLHIRNYSDK